MAPGGDAGRWLVRTVDNQLVIDFDRGRVVFYTGRGFETVTEPLVALEGSPVLGEPLRVRLRDRNGAEREVATTSVQDVRRLITQAEVDSGRPQAC